MGQKKVYPEHPILIVDDYVDFLNSMQTTLRMNGLTNTVLLDDNSKVLPKMQEQDFSLVLLDIVMPGIESDKLLCKIKEKHPDIPVIMITGSEEYATARSGFDYVKLGADDYILKSNEDTEKMIEKIRKALNTLPEFFDIEAGYYKELMEICGHNQSLASRLAGIHKRNFSYRLKKIEEELEKKGKIFEDIPNFSQIVGHRGHKKYENRTDRKHIGNKNLN